MDRMTSEFSVYDQLIAEGFPVTVCHWKELPDHLEPTDAVAFRLVWGYDAEPESFRAVVERAAAQAGRIIPELPVFTWNVHKKYLFELQESGVSMPRCVYHERGTFDFSRLSPDTELVIKPAISAGARGIIRCNSNAIFSGQITVPADVLVQEFCPAVKDGERSQIFFGGRYSHAVIKTPAAGDFRVQKIYGGTVGRYEPSAAEKEWALDVLLNIPYKTEYARVDYLQSDGKCLLMELELIESELFLLDSAHQQQYASTVRSWLLT